MAAKARRRIGEHIFPKITEETDGGHRFVEDPPITARAFDEHWQPQVRAGIAAYRETLTDDRRFLFDRYRVEDFALRVVGIGSVATRCYVGLLFCDDKNPLLLQVKEARPSVLEPYAGKSPFANQGQRVVVGQRMMQAASDMFLGWLRGAAGHDFYVRQLRDMKLTVSLEGFTRSTVRAVCRKVRLDAGPRHAKSGDAAMISGYLGRGEKMASALRISPWPMPTRRNATSFNLQRPAVRGGFKPSAKMNRDCRPTGRKRVDLPGRHEDIFS